VALTETRISELLLLARRGDDAAASSLIGGMRERVFRWALIITGDSDDAEDVTQQVSVSLHRNLNGFDERSRFTTWVYAIARNAALEVSRRASRRHEVQVDSEDLPQRVTDDVDEQIDRIANRRAARIVRAYFAELPPRQRELIELIDTQGLTAAEAAKLLGIEPETARVHLMRARRTIRSKMLESHPEMFT
jgi:RNA polymerase sigma-70 factor (ECF subfamily)